MVQRVLISTWSRRRNFLLIGTLVVAALVGPGPLVAAKKPKPPAPQPWPELLLEQGRKLTYEQTVLSQRDLKTKQGFWSKFVDVVAGQPYLPPMGRPYGIAVDSKSRIIVTDPGMGGIHIFDTRARKYKFIERQDKSKDPMFEPQCIALDQNDNIYVTDPRAGKIFVFDPSGKSRRVFGSLKGGEGFFKRPTGISIDPQTGKVFVTDTLRDRVYILDKDGTVIKSFGQRGAREGEFNLPTSVLVSGGVVAVVDAMNFRVQLFDESGAYKGKIGRTGDPLTGLYRPRGLALDSERHVYVTEGDSGLVQVFDLEGRLLYQFGTGTGFGEFSGPAGVFIDKTDKVYLVDSLNRRVQIFQYHALTSSAGAAK